MEQSIKEAYLEGYLQKIALKVYDREPFKKRPVSGTIGRIGGLTALLTSSTAPLRKTIGREDEEISTILEEGAEDESLKGSAVSLGSFRPVVQAKRILRNKQLSTPSKMLGIATLPGTAAISTLLRADNYNPFSDMATMFNNEPAILRHELGHAQDFKSRKYPGLYALSRYLPPMVLYQEWKAYKNAIAAATSAESKKEDPAEGETKKSKKKLDKMKRLLYMAFGTYAGGIAYGSLRKMEIVPGIPGPDVVRRLAPAAGGALAGLLAYKLDPLRWSPKKDKDKDDDKDKT